METLDFDHEVYNAQAAEADRNLAVRFYTLPMKDESASANEGRPIYRDVTHVEIRVRGSRNDIVVKPVNEEVKRRFRDAWRAYEQGEKMMDSGTPLAEWASMSKSMVEEMKHFGFFTVEHIANARDDVVSKFPGLRNLQNKAKNFLELAKGNAPLEALQKTVDETKSENEALKAQLADMGRRMAAMEAKQGKE